MRVGPTRHHPQGADISWTIFVESGEDCIVLGAGEMLQRCCVALWEPAPLAADGYVWLKTWGENEGIDEALVAAGVVTLTQIYQQTGYELARLAQLTQEAVEDRDAVLAANFGMSAARQGARAVSFSQRPYVSTLSDGRAMATLHNAATISTKVT